MQTQTPYPIYNYRKIPALVTLPDGNVLGDGVNNPTLVVVFDNGDDTHQVQVWTATERGSDPILEFESRLTTKYTGPFQPAAVLFETEAGNLAVGTGPGCGCGWRIKSYNPPTPSHPAARVQ